MKTPRLLATAMLAVIYPLCSLANGGESKAGKPHPELAVQIQSQLSYPDFVQQLPGKRVALVHFYLSPEKRILVERVDCYDHRLQNYVLRELSKMEFVADKLSPDRFTVRLRFE